jgi:hypothetical protein
MTVEAIKEAIQQLPESERISLASWLNASEYDQWDSQMAADFSPGGAGSRWAEQVKREIADGKARPLDEGFSQRGRRQ